MNVVVEGCAVVGEGGGCGQLASFLGAKPPAKALKFKDDEGHIWVGIGKRPEWCKAALAAGKTPVKCSNAGSSALCVTPDFEGLMARRGGITSGASCPMVVRVVERNLAQMGKHVFSSVKRRGTMLVQARSTVRAAPCPSCRCWSGRLRGNYRRILAERPILAERMVLSVELRRFKCLNAECPRHTFAEDIHALAGRHQRSHPIARPNAAGSGARPEG